jgi:uncharacterized protein
MTVTHLPPRITKSGQFTEVSDNRVMKFVRESGSAVTVRQVEKGMIKVGDQTVTENVILFRDTIRRGWHTDDVRNLKEEDLADLIAEEPEIILFGSGWQSTLPPRELVFALARKGIGFETMSTPAACRTFNILVSEGRDVAVALVID